MRSILYYPDINIKDQNWLRNAVLYWDKVSSIVPKGDKTICLSPEICELMEQECYRPIYPSTLFESEFLPDFEEEVIERLSDPQSLPDPRSHKFGSSVKAASCVPDLRLPGTDYGRYYIQEDKLPWHELPVLLHQEKTNGKLYDFMCEHKLLHWDGNGNWYVLDERIARLYMSLLAKYLAKAEGGRTGQFIAVGTDRPVNLSYAYENVCSPLTNGSWCIDCVMQNVLPTPRKGVPLKKILSFRRRYRDELLQFRHELDSFEKSLKTCGDAQEIQKSSESFREKMELETGKLIRIMHQSGVEAALTTVKSLIELDSSSVPALLSALAIGSHSRVLSAASYGMIKITASRLNLRKQRKEILSDSGFAYLYHANTKKMVSVRR
ncbi:DUF6236 family protein [Diplocloster modestus]|uniref:Uncharacterized protein n=1 Tax=Diplocloster modestus TaxID=2850322 RepID=A0ABS6KCC0_9FIRM|nr:DUF6236 family protein [Diplocloster modestus]MBU9728159.1 hypothetical protein [Diplocloster modestus]